MKPLPHGYEVRLTGGQSGYAALSSAGVPALRTAPPPDFDGPGDAWSPEQLLLASVQSCYLFTLRAVARASGLGFQSIVLDAMGTVDRESGVTRFTGITLRPTLTIEREPDRVRAYATMERAARACLVSASLAVPVRVEPEVKSVAANLPREWAYGGDTASGGEVRS